MYLCVPEFMDIKCMQVPSEAREHHMPWNYTSVELPANGTGNRA